MALILSVTSNALILRPVLLGVAEGTLSLSVLGKKGSPSSSNKGSSSSFNKGSLSATGTGSGSSHLGSRGPTITANVSS